MIEFPRYYKIKCINAQAASTAVSWINAFSHIYKANDAGEALILRQEAMDEDALYLGNIMHSVQGYLEDEVSDWDIGHVNSINGNAERSYT